MEIEKLYLKRWLKPAEFSIRFSISRPHLYSLLAQRRLPAVKKPGFGWLIDSKTFERELEASVAAGGHS